MVTIPKYRDKIKTVRTGQDKKTGKETFTTINNSHHPISKKTKDRNREKARYRSGRIYDGRSRVPTQEYKDGWNEIFGKKNND
tara:strand:+ start:591 stop:839 length:249 start_codon:yes stop_codon:yes gene_type:complete